MRSIINENKQDIARLTKERVTMEIERRNMYDRLKMVIVVCNLDQQHELAVRISELNNQIAIKAREIEVHSADVRDLSTLISAREMSARRVQAAKFTMSTMPSIADVTASKEVVREGAEEAKVALGMDALSTREFEKRAQARTSQVDQIIAAAQSECALTATATTPTSMHYHQHFTPSLAVVQTVAASSPAASTVPAVPTGKQTTAYARVADDVDSEVDSELAKSLGLSTKQKITGTLVM